MEDKTLTLHVDQTNTTIRQIKALIEKELDIPASKQNLNCGNLRLGDDGKRLSEYIKKKDCTLMLFMQKFVHVNELNGRRMTFTFNTKSNVMHLKVMI